jgi:hypothetical protein
MKRTIFAVLLVALSFRVSTAANLRRLKPTEIGKIRQALEDEIYDYGYYGGFYQIGENTGTAQHWIARSRLYINPVYDTVDGNGAVIYKLMPYGQVYRVFFIDKNGDIKLDGNPQNKFPITQPSHQTVFMDEDELCRFESTWIKTTLVVNTEPTTETIRTAAHRQKVRTGFSDWEYKHPTESAPNR